MGKYKNGDAGLISMRFKFTVGGFVQLFIRIFENAVYLATFQFKKMSIFHHVFSIVKLEDGLHVFEAIPKGYTDSGLLEDYLKNKDIHKFLILRPKFEFSDLMYIAKQKEMLGCKYWFWGTLVLQLIKQLTLDWIWLGKKRYDRFYCSESTAYALCYSSGGVHFKRWWAKDPQDFYVSKDLERATH